MDNVTHTLFALTLARTPLGRHRGAAAALVLASNAPDIDIVAAIGGGANYLAWHRGPTHGPLGVVGLGLVTAALVWGGARFFGARSTADASDGTTRTHRDRTAFATLFAVALVGVLAHVLMDLPTSYGTRLLSPFSGRWFAMDLMPIIDVYLLTILVGALVLGRGSPQRRRKAATLALVLMAANYGVRTAAHQQALAAAERDFGPGLPTPCDPRQAFRSLLDSWPRQPPASGPNGACLVETAAIPGFFSPLNWRVIAQLPDAYEMYDINLTGRPGPPVRIANEWTPVVAAAARTPTAQVLFGFSRFPDARLYHEPSGETVVQFTDMRFVMGIDDNRPLTRRSALFTVTVTFDAGGAIVTERLGD